jgi:hypothetical protein
MKYLAVKESCEGIKRSQSLIISATNFYERSVCEIINRRYIDKRDLVNITNTIPGWTNL